MAERPAAPPTGPESGPALSAVTDRIELGLILHLPPASLRRALRDELAYLATLSDGRLRVTLDLRGVSLDAHAAGLDARRARGDTWRP
ncbi:MAG: hypothetical protein HGA45_24345 [Chloroflexales bacterium]|nr:hypothetical protein [Chloroflexales bacterium]